MELPIISGNWIDLVILIIFFFYAIEGYGVGFVRGLSDFIGFIISFIIALNFYTVAADFLVKQFSLPHGMSNALGFFLTAFIVEIFLAYVVLLFVRKGFRGLYMMHVFGRLDRVFGIVPGVATALVLIAFFLSIILTLPLSPFLKKSVSDSKIGGYLSVQSLGLEKSINQIFGKAANEALTFLTIAPRSGETVNLRFTTSELTVDPETEQAMLALVNQERVKKGLSPLVFDTKLREVARSHAKDMFERGYFSHYTPEGLSPFDRMAQANISYNAAGENLALAPSVELAHRGLMESPGHRANILSSDFGRVGIGVMDGGIYGKMFVQEFTD